MEHVWDVYQDDDGSWRIRVDAPGERAVSAAIGDPFGFCSSVAQETGLDVSVDSQAGILTIHRDTE